MWGVVWEVPIAAPGWAGQSASSEQLYCASIVSLGF